MNRVGSNMSMVKDIVSRIVTTLKSQMVMLTSFFIQIQNVGMRAAQAVQQKVQKFIQNFLKKPGSKKDYFRFFGMYFSKRFVTIFVIVLGVLGYLLVYQVYPWADGKLWTSNIRIDTPKYAKFGGKARVYNTDGKLVYEGTMEKGMPQGYGIQYDYNGNLIYKGSFEGGKYSGQGELYNSAGVMIYSGSFSNNNYEGEGKLFNDIGKLIYVGNFSVGQRSGTGIEYDPSTQLKKYYGEYANNVRNGNGVEYEEDGTSIKYEGSFKDDFYGGGQGKLYSGGNLLYSGAFANGFYEGTGTLYDLDTGVVKYVGEFKNGLYDGTGKLYDVSTSVVIYEGSFSKGKRQGSGTSYDKLGSKQFDGNFRGDSIDYIGYLGQSPDKIKVEFGQESYRTETDGKLIITYLSMDASLVFKVNGEKGEYVCDKIILGIKEKFMGLGSQSTAVERRTVMGEPFSSINYSCPSYYSTVFSNLAININKITSVPSDKYIMDNYFIRFYFNDGRTELKCIEIGSMG